MKREFIGLRGHDAELFAFARRHELGRADTANQFETLAAETSTGWAR